MLNIFRYLFASIVCVGIIAPTLSLASVGWWTKSNYCVETSGPSNACYSEFADSRTFKGDDDHLLTATAWSNTSGGGNTIVSAAEIAQYGGGLGVRNADWNTTPGDQGENGTPEHAMDNNERFDMILFDFHGLQINLEEVTVGWYSSDADISVLAYTGGNGLPDEPVMAGRTLDYGNVDPLDDTQDLTSNGWEIVGNYDVDYLDPDPRTNSNGNVIPQTATINPGGVSSSYWLIGAYNPLFASAGCDPSSPNYCNGPNTYPDYVKIMDLVGSIDTPPPPTSVPEPGTLLLLASALLLLTPKARRVRAA